jgi:hypothetical protein
MEQKGGLDTGKSIDRCWMDVKNRRNLPHCLPFRNKTPGQFTLIEETGSSAGAVAP